ncbi:MAG: hypothetical protein U0587_05015 [Candidatus Binatia bacterium]
MLRERWRKHTESTLVRPVLIIDEAQEMYPATLNELHFLAAPTSMPPSAHRRAGRRPAALPTAFAPRNCSASVLAYPRAPDPPDRPGRRSRAHCVRLPRQAAGNAELMTPGLIETLCSMPPATGASS